MRTLLAVALLAMLSPVTAMASTPAAMARGLADTAKACRTASGFRDAAIVGDPILFSDKARKTAILVTGIWRPAHMKGARGTVLCLYDRVTRSAETQEAAGWAAATTRR